MIIESKLSFKCILNLKMIHCKKNIIICDSYFIFHISYFVSIPFKRFRFAKTTAFQLLECYNLEGKRIPKKVQQTKEEITIICHESSKVPERKPQPRIDSPTTLSLLFLSLHYYSKRFQIFQFHMTYYFSLPFAFASSSSSTNPRTLRRCPVD